MSFFPDPSRARHLASAIGDQLASSLTAVGEACRGIVKIDRAELDETIAAIRAARRTAPPVFAIYYEILAALARRENELAAERIAELCRTRVERTRLAYRQLTDADLGEDNAQRYARWFDVDDDTPLEIVASEPEVFDRACGLADEAFAILDAAAPDVSAEIRELVCELLIARAPERAKVTFDGASSFYLWGVVLLNSKQQTTPIRMLEALAHECAHSFLFAMALDGPLVLNADEERHPSPLRHDPRPLDGIFHAAFVSARMHYALSRLLSSGLLNAEDRLEVARMRDEDSQHFSDGLAVVEEHAELTPLGRELLDSAKDYMLQAAAAR